MDEPIQPQNANKKPLGLIIGGIILLILVGFFVWNNKPGTEALKSENSGAKQEPLESQKGKKSFKDLMLMSKSQKCSVAYDQQGQKSQGSVYVANGMMRGDFSTEIEGKTMGSHMISNKDYFYSWTDGMKEGFKMKAPTDEATKDVSGQNETNLDQPVDYTCENWSNDGLMFKLPENVEFKDYSSMMQPPQGNVSPETPNQPTELPASAKDPKAMQCAACQQLGAEDKAQCLAALKCN